MGCASDIASEVRASARAVPAAAELEDLMCEMSWWAYSASWYQDIATVLWRCVTTGDRRIGNPEEGLEVSVEVCDRLRRLADESGLWWEHETPIPLAVWRVMYASRTIP
jgi:hypothetical protein